MGIFNSINISSSGLTSERMRMEIISKNIANANTTKTSSGTPYRRQMLVLKENKESFSKHLSNSINKSDDSKGVKVSKIVEDKTPFKKIYDPGHPEADDSGYVSMPNIDVIKEMIDMISATRAYEANVTAINSSKSMAMRALDIGR